MGAIMKVVLLESLGISNDQLEQFVEPLRAKGIIFESFSSSPNINQQIERIKDERCRCYY